MNKLIKSLEEIIDKKATNNELRQELSSLVKMLKTGFANKPTGMEKVPKVFAANDPKKIKKFYDTFGNQINALKLSGNFDIFASYLDCEFGISISYKSDVCPNMQYIKKGKKLQKFQDLYTTYFLDSIPKSADEAATRILKSLDNLTKEFHNENEVVKESLKAIIEAESNYTPETVKTVDRILTKSRIKSMSVEDVAGDIELKLTSQQKAVDMVTEQ